MSVAGHGVCSILFRLTVPEKRMIPVAAREIEFCPVAHVSVLRVTVSGSASKKLKSQLKFGLFPRRETYFGKLLASRLICAKCKAAGKRPAATLRQLEPTPPHETKS
jgi:hypothetical protein